MLTKHCHQFRYCYCTECSVLQRLLPGLWDTRSWRENKLINLLGENDVFICFAYEIWQELCYTCTCLPKNIRHLLQTTGSETSLEYWNFCDFCFFVLFFFFFFVTSVPQPTQSIVLTGHFSFRTYLNPMFTVQPNQITVLM